MRENLRKGAPLDPAGEVPGAEIVPDGVPKAGQPDVGRLFRDHNQTLVRFLRVRLGSEQEAKEVAQEAYVRLLQLEQTGAISFMRAYLFKIAANLAIDRIRQRHSQGPHESIDFFEELTDSAAPERTVMATEQLDILTRSLGELPADCAKTFEMIRVHGMRQDDVAQALGISERMVRYHMVQALLYCKLRLDGLTAAEAKRSMKS